jgi:hypothetical protein
MSPFETARENASQRESSAASAALKKKSPSASRIVANRFKFQFSRGLRSALKKKSPSASRIVATVSIRG